MDTGSGPPVTGPLGRDSLDTVENEIEQQHPDPLAGMLEKVENSIEQSLPHGGMPNEPPDTTLDHIERATENQIIPGTQLPEHMQDPLHDLPDALEMATENENQVIKPEGSIEAPAPEPDEVYGSFLRPVVPHLEERWAMRERSYSAHRMTGSQTGARYNGSGMTYCRLRDAWISPDDCDNCNAFEPAEDASSDEERCRYAF